VNGALELGVCVGLGASEGMKVWVGTKVSTGVGGAVELGGGGAGVEDRVATAGAGASQGATETAVLVGE
jgi:hypothetical protein